MWKKISALFKCFFFCIVFVSLSTSMVSAQNPATILQEERQVLEEKQNELIIQYKDKKAGKKLLNTALSSKAMLSKKITPRMEVIRPDKNMDIDFLIKELKKDKSVLYVEKNKKLQLQALPNDPYYYKQWGLKTIMAEEAWDIIPPTTAAVTVAVIDTGIDEDHPDLINRLAPGGRNFFYDNYNINDNHGHGTAVSSVIAAEINNTIGIAGVAGTLDVKILPLKTSSSNGSSYLDDVIDAIDYAIAQKVDIINLSMGSDEKSDIENDAIQRAVNAGIIVLASAGNEENSSYLYPASYENVISVGSVSRDSRVSDFSNYNDKVDVVAPGEEIYTCTISNQYASYSGTSFSTPVVSGMAAVMKAINPALTREQIEGIIKNSSTDMGNAGRDNYYGYGLVNFYQAVHQASQTIVPVSSISLDKLALELGIGESQQLTASILPANASNKNISWLSDSTSIAIVDNNGLVTAVGEGTAYIRAVTADGTKKASCKVTVGEVISSQDDWEEWEEEKTNVSAKHTWTIKFSSCFASSSITSNIFVAKDISGTNKVAGITPTPSPTDSTCVLLSPPAGGWQAGETYYLFITTGIQSNDDQALNNAVRMKFTIE